MIRKVYGMSSDLSNEHRASVLDEIHFIIVKALRNRDAIRPKALSRIMLKSYPDSGLSEALIAAGLCELQPKLEYQSSRRRRSNSYEAHSGERRLIAPQQVHEGVKFGMPVKLRTSHTAGAGRDAAV